MLLAAMPWAYWMVFPLLAATVLVVAAFGMVYLKKVVEPHLLLQDALVAAKQPLPQPVGWNIRGPSSVHLS